MAATAPEVNQDETTSAPWLRRNRGNLVVGALGSIIVALLVLGVFQYLEVSSGREADDRQANAVRVASQLVTNLTSVSKDTANSDIDELLRDTTGTFREQFGQQAELFRKVVTGSKVSSKGDVVAAGASSFAGNKAVVLVAATATVKNKEAPEGQRRVYRMRVTLQRDADRWLASNLELVP